MLSSLRTWANFHNPLKFVFSCIHFTDEMEKVKPRMVILCKVAQLFTSEWGAGSLKQVCVMLMSALMDKISTVFLVGGCTSDLPSLLFSTCGLCKDVQVWFSLSPHSLTTGSKPCPSSPELRGLGRANGKTQSHGQCNIHVLHIKCILWKRNQSLQKNRVSECKFILEVLFLNS